MSTQKTAVEEGLIQFLQVAKLVGSDSPGQPEQGSSVAVSADGNTAVVGGPNDNESTGAVWIFTRTEATWTQQGSKLVPTDPQPVVSFGDAVAISADGNTIIAGASAAYGMVGAAWIFTRAGGVWTQQAMLMANDNLGNSGQGSAVAISADGNTCAVGGPDDNDGVGAAWIFSRANGPWTQVGQKLIGSGFTACNANQGTSVALSGDGSTLIIGSAIDDRVVNPPVWVFVNNNGWQQQGNYLTASDATPNQNSETTLSISADGKVFMLGENTDNGCVGAAWIFTCNSGTWNQLGSKLVGTNAIGNAEQGCSVAISADGKTAIVGGDNDNAGAEFSVGAAWVYQGNPSGWWQIGKIVANNAVGKSAQGTSVSISGNGFTLLSGAPMDNNAFGATWVFNKVYTPE